MPEADTPMEEGPDDAAPVEEAAPVENDNRDQQAANAVEREIGGKTFKLGRLLSQEEQGGSRGDFTPLGCFRMVRLGYARHRP